MPFIPKTPVDPQAKNAMFRYQTNLPKLPVPDLYESLQKYLASVRPLLTEDQYKDTLQAVNDFKATGGPGHELQRRLIEYSKDSKVINWHKDFHLNHVFLSDRRPLFSSHSYSFVYKDDALYRTPAQRAAAITTAALEFKRRIIKRELEPDYASCEPLCMDMYNYLFNTCRVASKPIDTMVKYDPVMHTHIVAIRKNKFYVIDCVYKGHQLSTKKLERQFQRIISQAGDGKGIPVGCFTTESRDKWADCREKLLDISPLNLETIQKIESASFVVCLDDYSPKNHDETSRAALHGDGRNRFFDKPLQFIVFENGKAAFIAEHTYADSSCAYRLNEFICDGLAKNLINHGSENIRHNIPPPNEISFITNRFIENEIYHAEKKFDSFVEEIDMTVLLYESFGKNLMKKFKCSPDGLVQMIIQLAYFRMFSTSKPTYASTQIRKFQHGRTEISRTVCKESVAFVKSMEDTTLSQKQKVSTLRSALNAQNISMKNAKEGRGIDGHLFSLKYLLRPEEEIPTLFTDYAFNYSSNWHLACSQATSSYFECFCLYGTHNDGINTPYMINDNSISFCIASARKILLDGEKYTNATFEFKNHLKKACDDVRDLMLSENPEIARLETQGIANQSYSIVANLKLSINPAIALKIL